MSYIQLDVALVTQAWLLGTRQKVVCKYYQGLWIENTLMEISKLIIKNFRFKRYFYTTIGAGFKSRY